MQCTVQAAKPQRYEQPPKVITVFRILSVGIECRKQRVIGTGVLADVLTEGLTFELASKPIVALHHH